VASQARAREIYSYDCSICHGGAGEGKTSLGIDAGWIMPDLIDPAKMLISSSARWARIGSDFVGSAPQ
jgi:hypothetical protein